MRGTYEAYILVKVKDGSQYVCALNRQKKSANQEPMGMRERLMYLTTRVIWN